VGDSKATRRLADGLGVFSLGLGTAQLVAPGAMNRLVGADDNPRNRAVHRWVGGAREFAVGVGIGSRRMPAVWLWSRVAGDMFDLGVLGYLLASPRRRPEARRRAALSTAAVAGVAAADVLAAVQLTLRHGAQNRQLGDDTSRIETSARITINRPVSKVFAYWQDLENLPRFMTHLQSVQSLGGGRSRWRAAGPAGREVEWDAEITDERLDEVIAWRSVAGATVPNSGKVEFRAAPGARGTEVRVRLIYDPPAGKLGTAVAKLFGEAPDQQMRDNLRRLKQVLETGEVVRSEGSPEGAHARRQLAQRPAQADTR
jgi:uncharacterized membrane protein